LFVGWSPHGPTDQALRLKSFSDYERNYGVDPGSLLGYSVRHFFDNGGLDACVIRIAGADGAVIGPTDAAFHAALAAAFDTGGIVAGIDLFSILCVPGLIDAAMVAIMQRRARERRAFLILDCAEADTVATVIDALAGKTGADAPNSALYFPWVEASDPLHENVLRAFPPCGFVAGIFARTDLARGVWKAPAGIEAELTGAVSPTILVGDAESGQLSPHAVNCIRSFPNFGTVLFGARTLDGDDTSSSDWKFIPVRRLALFLEESISRGTKWAVFEPNGEPLWAQLRLSVGAFMQNLFVQGAFAGATPEMAHFVRCDATTTTQADIDRGVVNIVVGFAPLRPAEFVILTIQQIAGGRA
jgi:phage tail sheath protein FI